MNRKEDFKAELIEWKRRELPELVKRSVALPLKSSNIVSLCGCRRSGKTFLLFQTIKTLSRSRDDLIYINFESERLRNLDAGDMQDFLIAVKEVFSPQDKIYLFLDEIQSVRDWDKWVRRVYDTGGFYIFITGSTSRLLPREIATSLRGRTINFTIFPFSFREFLNARNYEPNMEILQYTDEKGKILKLLREYLRHGSFPEVILKDNEFEKKKLLSSYFDAILYRDVVERFRVKDTALLESFIRYTVNNFANYFSISKTERFLKSTGIRCSKKTLANFLNYFQQAFFLFPIEIFSYKVKDRLQYPKKIYLVDTGIINELVPKFSENYGRFMENVVAIELMRREQEVYYWKDSLGKEVDFVIKEGLRVTELIQVCYDTGDEKTVKREVSSLIKAMKEFELNEGLIITSDYEGGEEVNGRKIIYTPLWKWLLSNLLPRQLNKFLFRLL
jgi:predicted AAA+ superfamily ATPase